jgi:hypothetical protein
MAAARLMILPFGSSQRPCSRSHGCRASPVRDFGKDVSAGGYSGLSMGARNLMMRLRYSSSAAKAAGLVME